MADTGEQPQTSSGALEHVLSDVWTTTSTDAVPSDDCGPTRVCRNARDFSFDGIAEEGEDIRTAWRRVLESEGKISPNATTIGDLVLGRND